MSSQNAMLAMYLAKSVLSIALALLFWKRKLHRRFAAMGIYLGLHAVSAPVVLYLLYSQSKLPFDGDSASALPFFVTWALYSADALLLYFICMAVFRSALAPFAGLMKFGIVVFRWVALVSGIVGLSTIPVGLSTFFTSPHVARITPSLVFGLTRSVSILELCLLTFLCLSMNALRLSVRDAAFGICLGFGVLSASEFVQSLLTSLLPSSVVPIHFVGDAVLLLVLGIWGVYFAMPDPTPKPVLIPANSTIYRWNEIASALGYTGTKVAVQQPANGFFLTDVERVVEMVLARNIKGGESEP
jgi:hypothetical protein